MPLTREEEQDAFRRLRAGEESQRARIFSENRPFAWQQARKYSSLVDADQLDDLRSIAEMALYERIGHFDPDRGVKFISYAVWWLKRDLGDFTRAQQKHKGQLPLDALDSDILGKRDKEPNWLTSPAQKVLSLLPSEDAKILKLYYGLQGEPHTFAQIAAHLGVSRQRVQQRLKQTIAHLRQFHGPNIHHLKEAL